MRNAIVIMSKVPKPGYTKTRLMNKLTGEECAALHKALLTDICRNASRVVASLFVFYIGGQPKDFAEVDLFDSTLREQKGQNLGERIQNALKLLAKEYDKVLIVGTDIPELGSELLEQALEGLEKYSVVLGPAKDGGYYLIGLNENDPSLFQDIPWGTSEVFNKTVEAIKQNNLTYLELEMRQDIDTWTDLLEYHRRTQKGTSDQLGTPQIAREIVAKYLEKPIEKDCCTSCFATGTTCGQ